MGRPLSPLGAAVRGAVAGAIGTAAMDLIWYRRYRVGGGDQSLLEWEFASGVTWDSASAPAQVGRRLAEGFLQRPLPDQAAPRVNDAVHWGTGLMWGAAYGIVVGSRPAPRIAYGAVFGPIVCLTSYAVLPLAKLYKPIWQYDAKALAKDFSAHLAFGLGTSASFAALAALARSPSSAGTSPSDPGRPARPAGPATAARRPCRSEML